jgi:dinuclear metal center YbgI/SA1388 family protein
VTTTIAQVIAAMERRYPFASAQLWDSVGLVAGNPDTEVTKILFAVDAAQVVIDEAVEIGAQLIIVHHPLILNDEVSELEAARKGKLIAQLIELNIGLFTAHTNADVAWPGVSDALAKAIGVEIEGKAAIDPIPSFGRIGKLPKRIPLVDFANQVSDSLPKTARGIHISGDLQSGVQRVAVSGGSGASLLDLVAQSDVDVYVTSDLKYHAAQEFVNTCGKALIDISHWAGEWTWLNQAAELLQQDMGGTLETHVSSLVTDPWSLSLN